MVEHVFELITGVLSTNFEEQHLTQILFVDVIVFLSNCKV